MDSVKPPAHQASDRLRSQRRDCQSLLRLVHSCHETRGTDAESTGLEERAARPGEAIHSADTCPPAVPHRRGAAPDVGTARTSHPVCLASVSCDLLPVAASRQTGRSRTTVAVEGERGQLGRRRWPCTRNWPSRRHSTRNWASSTAPEGFSKGPSSFVETRPTGSRLGSGRGMRLAPTSNEEPLGTTTY